MSTSQPLQNLLTAAELLREQGNKQPVSLALREYGKVSARNEVENSPFIVDESGRIGVRVTSGRIDQLLPQLENIGFNVGTALPDLNLAEGWISPENIEALTSLLVAEGGGVIPIYQPVTQVGSVTSQADFVHDVARVRANLPNSFDGSGLEIGVLSDSYNNLGGEASDVASGDLPNNVDVLEDLGSGGSDEGRAMLQLIHDLAPGADLSFATAFTGAVAFADNIRALAAAGADVIVDDIGYLNEPFFQDGVVSFAVDDVFNNNDVAYFSSAGNSGNVGYESTNINFTTDPLRAGQYYDFNPGGGVDTRQRITIPNGGGVRLSLQWDDPFFTANGVDTDIDVFLVDPTGNIVASSIDANPSTQTPVEFLAFQNNTGQTDFDVLIQLFSGPAPTRLKYIPFGLGSNPAAIYQEFATNSPTVFSHPAAVGAQGVAAAPYFDQDTPEGFSSLGPTTILFADGGARLAVPEIRQAPDITAIDGTNTTFFGSDFEGDGFPNFFGTSAAAPHAAAIAAIVRQARPGLSASQVYDRLANTATDIGAPGFDNLTGAGLIDAYKAVFGGIVPASLNFTENFNNGDLPASFDTRSTNAGRIQVTNTNDPIGTRHLVLDNSLGGRPSLNEAILSVNAAGASNVVLSFSQKEFGDEDNAMPASFTGSGNFDGVALSVDGTNWTRLISLTGANSGSAYRTNTFNLSNIAAANGLTLSSNTRIKFQQFDDFPTPADGFAFDNISVTATANTDNDSFADSVSIFGPTATVTGSNVGFSSQPGEPSQSGVINSAWWSWTAPANTAVAVDTVGSNFDTFLSVFTGNSLNTLNTLAKNDDYNGIGTQSKLAFIARAGTTYHFAVDGLRTNTGNITLNLETLGPVSFGTAGPDILDGTAGNDYLAGLSGADAIRGFAGVDVIDGGAGSDNIFGVANADFLYGGANTDFLNYSDSSSDVNVTLGNFVPSRGGTAEGDINFGFENLVGSRFDDLLIGDAGNNVLRGGLGNDTLNSGAGNDTVFGEGGADTMEGGAGVDFLNYIESNAGVNVRLDSGVGVGGDAEGDTNSGFERLIGSNFRDTLTGNGIGNVLQGRADDDRLFGAGGNDILIGGGGRDTLVGGTGRDAFRFFSPAEGIDTIVDFNGDLIQVKGSNFGGGLPSGLLSANRFTLGSSATAASHRFIYNNNNGALYFDRDGSGAAGQTLFARVNNAGAPAIMSANNIQVI